MQIGIIGAGNVGTALAGSFVRAGHTVTISAAPPEEAVAAAKATSATAARSNQEAIEGAEAVLLAVPYTAVSEIVQELGTGLEGRIVIDVTNRINAENPAAAIDGTSNAEQIQSLVPAPEW